MPPTHTSSPTRRTRRATPAPRKARTAPRRSSRPSAAKATPSSLPGWDALSATKKGRNHEAPKPASPTDTWLSLPRFWMGLWLIAAGYILYVGHVQATKNTYNRVKALQQEQLMLNLKYNRLKAELDGQTGPKVIYERARALGLVEGYAYGPTITLEPSQP